MFIFLNEAKKNETKKKFFSRACRFFLIMKTLFDKVTKVIAKMIKGFLIYVTHIFFNNNITQNITKYNFKKLMILIKLKKLHF